MQTSDPCSENKISFLLDDKKLLSVLNKTTADTALQINPAIATVVNLGVSLFHLKETEKTEKPSADSKPNNKPSKEPILILLVAITITPMLAITIEIHVLVEIFSLKKINPRIAVIKGIAANINKVTAAVV